MTDPGEWARTVPVREFRRHPEALDETALSAVPGLLDDVRTLSRHFSAADHEIRLGRSPSASDGTRGPRRSIGRMVLWFVAFFSFATPIGAVFARSHPDRTVALPIASIALAIGVLAALAMLIPLRRSSPPSWSFMFVPGLGTVFGAVSLLLLAVRDPTGEEPWPGWWTIGVVATVGAGVLTAATFLVRSSAPPEQLERIDTAPKRDAAERARLRQEVADEWVRRLRELWDALPAADRDRVSAALLTASHGLAERRLVASAEAAADHTPGLLMLEAEQIGVPDGTRIDDSVAGVPRAN